MSELKTMEESIRKYDGAIWFKEVAISEIKHEAIKWVKNDAMIGEENHLTPPTIKWIKHFFNITEEELK